MLAGVGMLAGCEAGDDADAPAAMSAGPPREEYEAPPPMPSFGPISDQARRIFSDFGGRWDHSDVRYIGKLVVRGDSLEIYQFDFVNPQSNHGTRLIALLWNGREFVGRYAIAGHAAGSDAVVTGLDGSTIIFTCDEPPPHQRVERVTIKDRALPSKLWLCGTEASLETDGI